MDFRFSRALILSVSILFAVLLSEFILYCFSFPKEHKLLAAYPPEINDSIVNIEYTTGFRTNDLGLRERVIPYKRKNAKKRILFLGDSFTFGLGVEETERFSNLIEQEHNNVTCVNAGIVGTGPIQYANCFEKIGSNYQPDIVLICLYANDIQNCGETKLITNNPNFFAPKRIGIKKLAHSLFPRIFIATSAIFHTPKKINFFHKSEHVFDEIKQQALSIDKNADYNSWYNQLTGKQKQALKAGKVNSSALAGGFENPQKWVSNLELTSENDNIRWKNYKYFVEEIIVNSKQKNAQVGLIYIPHASQYSKIFHNKTHPIFSSGMKIKESWLIEQAEIEKRVILLAKNNDVPFLSLTSYLRQYANNQNIYYPLDLHFNGRGHKLSAQIIYNWLVENFEVLPTGN